MLTNIRANISVTPGAKHKPAMNNYNFFYQHRKWESVRLQNAGFDSFSSDELASEFVRLLWCAPSNLSEHCHNFRNLFLHAGKLLP